MPGWIQKLWAYFMGYDFFISYSHGDARDYCISLANSLVSLDFTCFIDRFELPPGEELTESLLSALRRSRVLILLGTRGARRSHYVKLEVRTFKELGRKIIPVNVDNGLHPRWPELEDLVYLDEDLKEFNTGIPSSSILDGISSSYQFTRRKVIRRRLFSGLTALFFILSLALAWQGWQTSEEARRTKEAVIVSGAIFSKDPLTSALLLSELGLDREPRDAVVVAHQTATEGFPEILLRGPEAPVSKVSVSASGAIGAVARGRAFVWRFNGSKQTLQMPVAGVVDIAFGLKGFGALAVDGRGVVITHNGKTSYLLPVSLDEGSVDAVSFSSDSKMLIAAGSGAEKSGVTTGWVRIWDLTSSPATPLIFPGHTGKISCVDISPNGELLATSGVHGPTKLWRLDNPRRPLRTFKYGTCAKFSPQENKVAVAYNDGKVEVFRINAGNEFLSMGQLGEHQSGIAHIAFSEDGRWLTTGSHDNTVMVWALDKPGRPTREVEHEAFIVHVEFDRTGNWILSRTLLEVKLFHREDRLLTRVLRGPRINDAHFSRDGTSIVTGNEDGTVRVWPVRNLPVSTREKAHKKGITSLKFNRVGDRFFSASNDGSLKLWEVEPELKSTLRIDHGALINTAAFSPDGSIIATAGGGGKIRLWQLTGGKTTVISACDKAVSQIEFSPNGNMLVASCFEKPPGLWSVGDQRLIRRFGTRRFDTIAIDPSGNIIALGALDGRFSVVRLKDGQLIFSEKMDRLVTDIKFHPRGARVAATSGNELYLWTIEGLLERSWSGHTATIWALEFSPDGSQIATSSGDGTVRIWNSDATAVSVILRGHKDTVIDVAFSPDGHRLASASRDGTTRIWNVDGIGRPLILRGGGSMARTSFDPNGKYVISGSSKGYLYKWVVSWKDLSQVLRNATNVCLTPTRRIQLLGEPTDVAKERFSLCEQRAGRSGNIPPIVRPN